MIKQNKIVFGTIIIAYLAMAYLFLSGYIILDANLYMGLVLAPYILVVEKNTYSFKYVVPLIIFLIVSSILPIKTVLFLLMLFALLFSIESCFGKINTSFIFLILILSPIYRYINNFIGFPIRLWLSEITGIILKSAGKNIIITGNIITMDNVEFSVDTACAGLNMLMTTFMIALTIVASVQRKSKQKIPLFREITFLIVAFSLNILSNLLRIITLVLFKIMPDTIFHEIVGVLCLCVYVILPLLFISKYVLTRKNNNQGVSEIPNTIQSNWIFASNLVLIALIYYAGVNVNTNSKIILTGNNYAIEGFKKETLNNGVIKFENNNSLVYLKPLQFYSAEHNPMICWTGSGYEFKNINKEIFKSKEIYTGILEKGKERIYTAWWFDNGKNKTISQFNWRWSAIKDNSDYFLINVNAVNKEQLIYEINKLLKTTNYKKT